MTRPRGEREVEAGQHHAPGIEDRHPLDETIVSVRRADPLVPRGRRVDREHPNLQIEDLDADGFSDLMLGAPSDDPVAFRPGRVEVLSGAGIAAAV